MGQNIWAWRKRRSRCCTVTAASPMEASCQRKPQKPLSISSRRWTIGPCSRMLPIIKILRVCWAHASFGIGSHWTLL
ncbi:hypothetical protein PENSPDRAFT_96824 [Peniophora sp. CONT]|nr:hypothetical protein PENSPDRAFT_96824 [Peniophora sp. CONT]